MGYVYLFCVAMLFSFGGTCAKLISPYFHAGYITFFRFAVGVFFLLLLKLLKRQPFPEDYRRLCGRNGRWILFGAAAKWLAYLTENYALTHGPSYGNIITQPAQTVFLTLISISLFHEKLSLRKLLCIPLCVLGVLCISWNGRPLDVFFGENFLLTLLFIASGTLAGCHVLSQKMVTQNMDMVDGNLTIFFVAAALSSLPLLPGAASGELAGVHPDLPCILAILLFGFITGIGLYLNNKAIPLVPFYMVPIIQSTMTIFAILWGILFFHEQISGYILGGTALFMTGLIGLQLKSLPRKTKKAH